MSFENLGNLLSAVIMSAPATWAIVAILKKLPQVPLNEGQDTKIRAVAAALSAISTVLIGIADRGLVAADLQNFLAAFVAAIITYLGTQGMHHTVKKLDLE